MQVDKSLHDVADMVPEMLKANQAFAAAAAGVVDAARALFAVHNDNGAVRCSLDSSVVLWPGLVPCSSMPCSSMPVAKDGQPLHRMCTCLPACVLVSSFACKPRRY